jgi:hypothetical protein
MQKPPNSERHLTSQQGQETGLACIRCMIIGYDVSTPAIVKVSLLELRPNGLVLDETPLGITGSDAHTASTPSQLLPQISESPHHHFRYSPNPSEHKLSFSSA